MSCLVSFYIKFTKLKSPHRENKKIDIQKTWVFSLSKSSPVPWGCSSSQNIVLNFSLTSSDWNSGKSLQVLFDFIGYILCSTAFHGSLTFYTEEILKLLCFGYFLNSNLRCQVASKSLLSVSYQALNEGGDTHSFASVTLNPSFTA